MEVLREESCLRYEDYEHTLVDEWNGKGKEKRCIIARESNFKVYGYVICVL